MPTDSSQPAQAIFESFRLEVTVQPDDVDMLGHVSNIVYVRFIQDVASAHSRSVGMTYEALRQAGGLFVVRRHEIDYLRSAFVGERLALFTRVVWFRGASVERATRIERVADGVLLTQATTLWAFVGENGRPKRIPRAVIAAYSGYAATEG